MIKKCKYCEKEIEFEKNQQFAAHINNCKFNPNRILRYKKISEALKGRKRLHGVLAIEYKINCVKCNKEFIVKVTSKQFDKGNYKKHCSRKCANSHNRTKESKEKTSLIMKNYHLDNVKPKLKVEKICEICGISFFGKRKTCSEKCYKKMQSSLMSQRLSKKENRTNYGSGKRSYLEISFEKWLIDNEFKNFEIEKHFYNKELNKSYFADFTFKDKKLIIELDGTQHLKRIELDKERDKYIQEVYGYNVIRISHKEYINKSKEALVLSLLSSP